MPLYNDSGDELTPEEAMQYLQQQAQQAPTEGRPFVRDLENRLTKAQQERDEARKAAEEAKRQLGFYAAGLPTPEQNPLVTLFMQGYQGEATPEAIKAEAAKYGLLAPPQQQQVQQPQTQNPPAHQATFQAMNEAAQGQTVPGTRNWDGEITAAYRSGDAEKGRQLVNEKAAAEGRTTPGVVWD